MRRIGAQAVSVSRVSIDLRAEKVDEVLDVLNRTRLFLLEMRELGLEVSIDGSITIDVRAIPSPVDEP